MDKNSDKLKILNTLSYFVLVGIGVSGYKGLIGGVTLDNAFSMGQVRFIPSSIIVYLYLFTLFMLLLFIIFQLGLVKSKKETADKARFDIGWTASWSMLLHAAGLLFLFLGRPLLMLLSFLFSFIVLLIANGNARDDSKVFSEKLWVRNPYSIFMGLTIFMTMYSKASLLNNLLSSELNSIILVLLFTAVTAFFAMKNKNILVLITFAISLMSLYKGFGSNDLFSIVLLFAVIILVAYSIILTSRGLNRVSERKAANRAMPKFNAGRENELTKVLDPRLYKETRDLDED
ncbi:MAG: hypothetical protein QMB63_09285 [Clostridiaceae bacterium]